MSETLERVYPPKLMFLIVNPLMSRVMGTPLGKRLPDLARLDFEGRKSGRDYRVVVALHDIEGRTAALTNSVWRHNFENGHPATMHVEGTAKPIRGVLESDPQRVADAYAKRIDEIGVDQAARRLGIAVHSDEPPTHEELAEFAAREGLSIIYLEDIGPSS